MLLNEINRYDSLIILIKGMRILLEMENHRYTGRAYMAYRIKRTEHKVSLG